MDPSKKHKSFKPVWRPISTQSNTSLSHQAKNVIQSDASTIELGVQVQVVHSGGSGSVPQLNDSSKNSGTTSGVEAQVQAVHPGDAGLVPRLHEASKNEETTSGVADELSISKGTGLGNQGLMADKVEGVHLVNQSERHSISVEVSASLIRFLKGKRGSTHKQIEEETGAKIIFPSSKKENSVVIEGASVGSITKALEKIQVILQEAVKSPSLDYSHFISLPLAIHPGLVDKLVNFQNSILGTTDSGKDDQVSCESDEETSDETDKTDQHLDGGELNVDEKKEEVKTEIKRVHVVGDRQLDRGELKVEDVKEEVKTQITKIRVVSYPPKASKSSNLSDLGIEKSIFIKPKTFHITVLMLKLWNNERVTAAAEVLQRISSKVIDALEGRPISVRLKGLESMRGSLAKARVLYTPVEVIGGEDRLLRACQVITNAYVEAGLVLEKDANQKLKLHGTVMNARHRKRTKRSKRFDSFDARNIVERYGLEDWGEYLIPEVHLSQRFMFDENGYYHCCSSIPFPNPETKQV